ncbi:MAG: hypothetical protein ABR569_11000 [Gaiellaceae bacterium]
MLSLDDWLAGFDASEYHEVATSRLPERASAAALAMPVAPNRLVRTLLRLRGLGRRGTIEQAIERLGFAVLERTATGAALSASGKPWRPSGGLAGFEDRRPGAVRIAFVLAAGSGRLWTETRVTAVDGAARPAFLRDRRPVGPCSAPIRRRWLRAAAR